MRLAVGLGANLGDRESALRRAVELLGERLGPVLGCSRVHETEPLVLPDQDSSMVPRYLNAALVVDTTLHAHEILSIVRDIEHELGRRRDLETQRWQPRVIDIDLLALESEVRKDPELELPHPELHRRLFVLVPLAEVWPEWRHPIFEKSVVEMLAVLQRSGGAGQSLAQVL